MAEGKNTTKEKKAKVLAKNTLKDKKRNPQRVKDLVVDKTVVAEIESFDEFEDDNLNLERVNQLSRDDIVQILQFLNPVEDEKNYAIFSQELVKKPAVAIEKASIGQRIWSYFYEKMVLRILTIVWIAIAMKKVLPNFQHKISHQPDSPTEGMLILIGTALVINIVWRAIIALLESKRFFWQGAFFTRRNLGLKVVNKNGEAIGWLRAFLRGLFRGLPLNLITIFSIEFNKNTRGFHDRIFKTYVLKVNQKNVSSLDMANFIRENY